MKNWTKSDWVALVIMLVILAAVGVFLVWAIQDAQTTEARRNQCIQTGYAGRLSLAGRDYCFRLSGDTGELVKTK